MDTTKIYGIGAKTSKKLEKKHIRTIDQLKLTPSVLSNAQSIGLKYFSQISKAIPRAEVTEHIRYMKSIIKDPNMFGVGSTLAGSYRRGSLNPNDIDLIITAPIKPFIDKLGNYVLATLSAGKQKWAGVVRLPNSKYARRLDIIKADKPTDTSGAYWFALLYFTGSKEFNIKIRHIAKLRGYKMDQTGLYGISTGRRVAGIKSEQDIFKFLNVTYKPAPDRT